MHCRGQWSLSNGRRKRSGGKLSLISPQGTWMKTRHYTKQHLRKPWKKQPGKLSSMHFLVPINIIHLNNGITYIRHCFISSPVKHYPELSLDKDIIAAHWLSAEEILAFDFKARSPVVGKVLQDYLAGQRYPLSLIYHHLTS